MKSKHFKIHELVPKKMYEMFGDLAWRFVDPRLIESLDMLKDHFNSGTMTVNNYFWGGKRQWSGIRTPDSKYYSENSMHTFGKAVDFVCSDYSSEEIRIFIAKNPHRFPHIKGIEVEVDWVHIDIRNEDFIVFFKG